jgi:hypothetical protein
LPFARPYGKSPGENLQAAAPAPAPATAKAVGEPQELAQVEGVRRAKEDEEVKDIKALLDGISKQNPEPKGRAEYKEKSRCWRKMFCRRLRVRRRLWRRMSD